MLALIKSVFCPKTASQKVAESVEIREMSASSWWS